MREDNCTLLKGISVGWEIVMGGWRQKSLGKWMEMIQEYGVDEILRQKKVYPEMIKEYGLDGKGKVFEGV